MNENMKKIEALLAQVGYEKKGSTWRMSIEGKGEALEEWEREINRKGGKDVGQDAKRILIDAINDAKSDLEGIETLEEEGYEISSFDRSKRNFLRSWIEDAELAAQ